MGDIAVGAVLAIAVLFGASAVMKLRDLAAFREQVRDYALVPAPLLWPVALAVPVLELAASGLLAAPGSRRAGAALAVVLLIGFALAVAAALRAGRDEIACACFGQSSRTISWALPVRNAALAAVVAGAAVIAASDALPSAGAVAVLVLGGVLAALIVESVRLRVWVVTG